MSFVLILIGTFFFFNFNSVLFLHPQGVHFIRQTDSLSFVSNYYLNGFDFFHPALFNLSSIDAKGACEFPLIYYITALLYSIFGEKEFILRFINLLIFYIGLYHVYKMSFELVKDYFYALLIPLFILSSVSLVYYSFNFLPDPAALGLTFSGWYFVLKYRKNAQKKSLYLSLFCFTLSALIKVTYFINPLAVLGLCLFEFFFLKKLDQENKKRLVKTMKLIGFSFVLVLCWNIYVIWYNLKYESFYFTTSAMPFWNLTSSEKIDVWRNIIGEWYKKYLAQSSMHFLVLIIGFLLFSIRKIDKIILIVILFLLVGNLVYFFLFYVQLKYHDYYFLLFYPLVIFILILGIQTLIQVFQNKIFHVALKLILTIVVLSGMNYARMKVSERYQNGSDLYSSVGFALKKSEKQIIKLQIPSDAKILVAPDLTMNGGLYFLKRKGWKIDSIQMLTADRIAKYKKNGASYLFCVNSDLDTNEFINMSEKRILKTSELSIYKL